MEDQSRLWQPSLTPHEGQNSVDLDFNFWMHYRYISDSELHELIFSVLLKKRPPPFLKSNELLSHASTIVFVGVHGLSSNDLAEKVSTNSLPFLATCSAVPVRHSVTATRQELPHSYNITPPDISWRYFDVASMNSLLMWPVVPAVTFDEVALLRGNVGAIFRNYRLIFQEEMHLVSLVSNTAAVDDAKKYDSRFTVSERLSESKTWDVQESDIIGQLSSSAGNGIYILRQEYGAAEAGTNHTYHLYLHFFRLGKSFHLSYQPSLQDSSDCIGSLSWTFVNFEENTSTNPVLRRLLVMKMPLLASMRVVDVRADRHVAASWDTTRTEVIDGSGGCSNGTGTETGADVLSSIGVKRKAVEVFTVRTTPPSAARDCNEREEGEEVEDLNEACAGYNECDAALIPSVAASNAEKNLTVSEDDPVESVHVHAACLSRLKELYEECVAQGGFEDMVCCPLVLEMAGYNIDPNQRISEEPASPLTVSNHLLSNTAVISDQEDGEVAEDGELCDMESGSEGGATRAGTAAVSQEHLLDMKTNKYPSGALGICCIDCEMCETAVGNELTRVSVVCPVSGVVLDMLVKPMRPIINYNTKFSGITEEMLANVTTSLIDAKCAVSVLVQSCTILVGHSLESDLRALELNHSRVIDTAVLYPHPSGLPFKLSLRHLTQTHLKRSIQIDSNDHGIDCNGVSTGGHDSTEDAMATLELALLRVARRRDWSLLHKPWSGSAHGEGRYTFFHALAHERKKCGTTDGDMCITYCLRNVLSHLPPWEKFALGHRQESDVKAVYDSFLNDIYTPNDEKRNFEVKFEGDASLNRETFQSVISSLLASSVENASSNMIWVDVSLTASEKEGSSCSDLDADIARVFEAAPNGTLLVVVTEGDVSEVRRLLAKKQRSRWRDSSPWTETDEDLLVHAAGIAIAGTAFLALK